MSKRPNIVLVCTDHQRADYLSCVGHPLIKTPNLDKLAARGVLFENLHVQGTICMPSRASILTGTYPCRHSVTDNGYSLPTHHVTVADALRGAGYHTMAVGRTHVVCTQPRPEYPKTDFYGFSQCSHAQVYCADTDPGNDYLRWIEEEHPEYYDRIAFANRSPADDLVGSRTDVPEELSMNSWVMGRSLEFLRDHQKNSPEQPFMLWAGTWDPHSPYRAPEPWASQYNPDDVVLPMRLQEELDAYPEVLRNLAFEDWHKRGPEVSFETVLRNTVAMYMGMVSHIDDQMGRLLEGLEDMGIADETIVLFTSDHGDMLGEHWFLGKRIFFYDGALKVPGILAGPGVAQGKRFEGLAESVDLMPTLLDLAGVAIPPAVQGVSWVPAMTEQNPVLHEDVYSELQFHQNPFGEPEDDAENHHAFSIFDGRYRIVCFRDRDYGQLFDLQVNPESQLNYWDDPSYAEVKSRMKDKLLNRLMKNLHQPDTRTATW